MSDCALSARRCIGTEPELSDDEWIRFSNWHEVVANQDRLNPIARVRARQRRTACDIPAKAKRAPWTWRDVLPVSAVTGVLNVTAVSPMRPGSYTELPGEATRVFFEFEHRTHRRHTYRSESARRGDHSVNLATAVRYLGCA